MAENQGVLVCGEVADGQVTVTTRELLNLGSKLAAELGQPLEAALVGGGVSAAAEGAVHCGASKVYVVDEPILEQFQPDAYVKAFAQAVKEASPNIVLMGQTDMGRTLAPRLAHRLGTAVAMDCIALGVDGDSKLLRMTRAVYGGNAQADFVCPDARPQMATVRPKTSDPAQPDASRSGEVVSVAAGVSQADLRTKLVDEVVQAEEGIRLEDAEIVVTGGRGMGSAEAFDILKQLARVLGGAVGASRAAVDSGYAPVSQQIGLTGKIVSPKLYLAVALSGASQHMAGCSGAKTIVAINKDADANVFKMARYGLVGDYKQALPALIEECRKLVS